MMISKFRLFYNQNGVNLLLILTSAIFYIAIFLLAAFLNVWEDELYTLNTTSKNLQYALHQSTHFELQPPVYFLLLTIWRSISASIFWARAFSILMVALSQVLLYNFTKKLSTPKIAAIFSIFFLINPLTIFTALEIRPYALVLFLSMAITVLFYNTYYSNRTSALSRVTFILTAFAALFTQYYLGFLLFANSIVLIFTKKGKSLFYYLLDMAIPLIAIILYIPQIRLSLSLHADSITIPDRTTIENLTEVVKLLVQTSFGRLFSFNLSVQSYWFWIFKGVIVVLFLVSIQFSRMKDGLRKMYPFILIFTILYFFFVCLFWMFGDTGVANKYTTVMFVPVFMTMILMFIYLIKPRFLTFWIVILTVVNLGANFQTYHNLYKVNDYRSLSLYLAENEHKIEPIFVYRNIAAENLELYYRGENEIVPVPKAFSYNEGFGPDCWKITQQDIILINEKMLRFPSFYVIIERSNLSGVRESEGVFMDFLKANFLLVEDKSFKEGIKLYEFTNRKSSDLFQNILLDNKNVTRLKSNQEFITAIRTY